MGAAAAARAAHARGGVGALAGGRAGAPAGGRGPGAAGPPPGGAPAAGAAGERRTGQLLETVASRGPDVLHDLRVPLVDYPVNIDHAVVSGRRVFLIDSKLWRPGLYWALGGATRRGLRPTGRLASRNMHMARDKIAAYLRRRGLPARVQTPIVAVWSSRPDRPVRLAVAGTGLRVRRAGALTRILPRRPADPAITQALARLLYP